MAPPAKKNPLCPDCGENDPTKFGKNSSSATGIHYYCKKCVCERHKKWRTDNPVAYKDTMKRYRDNNKQKRKEQTQRWTNANRDRVRESQKKWIQKNKGSYSQWLRDYQNLQYARRHKDPEAEFISHSYIADRDGWICHLCGVDVVKENWSMDHLVPISVGGKHRKENVALAHRACNTKRHVNKMHAQLLLFG